MDENKKCIICGCKLSGDNLSALLRDGYPHCDKCSTIVELENLSKKHWDSFREKECKNEEQEYGPEHDICSDGINHCYVRELGPCEETYEIVNRTRNITGIIDTIESARKYLFFDISASFNLLESMFDEKNVFWSDGGNFEYYIKQSLISTLVIKLMEYFDCARQNLSRYSLKALRNRIENDKNNIFVKQRIFRVKKFTTTGHVIKTEFEPYPINEFFRLLDKLLREYEAILTGLKDYRDNYYAHIDTLDNEETSKQQLTLLNIRKVLNTLKKVYDSLLYAVAPDKYTHLVVDFNIWYSHMNQISDYWKENNKKQKKNIK